MDKITEKSENTGNIFTKKNSKPVENDKYIFRTLFLSMPANKKPAAILYLQKVFGFQSYVPVYSLLRIDKKEGRDLTAFQFLTLCKFFGVQPENALQHVNILDYSWDMDFFSFVTNDKLTA